MMKRIDEWEFMTAFDDYGRSDNFTRPARRALFAYLEELADDTGEDYRLDVVALCCEFCEWRNLAEFQREYGEEDYLDMESVRDATTVIEIDGSDGFITAAF